MDVAWSRELARWRAAGVILASVTLISAASAQVTDASRVVAVGRFSTFRADGPLPEGWQPWIINKNKKQTAYSLESADSTVVLKAVSEASASGMKRELRVNLGEFPILRWRWKAENLISRADNSTKDGEDSPVRVMVSFDGDRNKLSFKDRMVFGIAKTISGQELPYATLMYIWENRAAVGTVIPGPRTARIQMIVVESGPAKAGQWLTEQRNVYEDYKRAFGEEPGAVTAVGVMTDSDNTGQSATAYYGDIVYSKANAQ